MSDEEFLLWLYTRLEYRHDEDICSSHMCRLFELASASSKAPTSPGTVNNFSMYADRPKDYQQCLIYLKEHGEVKSVYRACGRCFTNRSTGYVYEEGDVMWWKPLSPKDISII